MNRVFPVAGLILLVGLAGILIAPHFIDWDQYRSVVTEEAQRLTGRTLVVNGDVDFDLFPTPSLSLDDIRLANIPGATVPDMIDLPRLELAVAFWPLLRGEVRVTEVKLIRPNVVFEVAADDRKNWIFAPREDTGFASLETQLEAQRVFVDHMTVEDAVVRYVDLARKQDHTVSGMSGEISAYSPRGPFRLEGQADYENEVAHFQLTVGAIEPGRAFPVSLDTFLDGAGLSTLFSGIVTEANRAGRFDGKVLMKADDGGLALGQVLALLSPEARGLADLGLLSQRSESGSLPVEFKAGLTVGLDTFELRGLELTSELADASGDLRYEFGDAPLLDAKLRVRGNNTEPPLGISPVGNSNVAQRIPPLLSPAVELLSTLADATFDIEVHDIVLQGIPVSKAVLKGNGLGGLYRFDALSAQLAGAAEARLTGELRIDDGGPVLDGRFVFSGNNFSDLSSRLGVPLLASGGGAAGPFSFASVVRATDEDMVFDGFEFALGDTRIGGQLQTVWAHRPVLRVDLNSERLDLDYLFGGPKAAAKKSAGGLRVSGWPVLDTLLALSAKVDLEAVLKAREVVTRQTQLHGFNVAMEATGGVVSLADMSWSGGAGGRIALNGMVASGHGLPLSSIEVSATDMALDELLTVAGLSADGVDIGPGLAHFDGRVTSASSEQGGIRASAKFDGAWGQSPFSIDGSVFGNRESVDASLSIERAGTHGGDLVKVLGLIEEPLTQPRYVLRVKADLQSVADVFSFGPEFETGMLGLDGPLRLDARLTGDGEEIALGSLAVLLAGNQYTGDGSLVLANARPMLTLSLKTPGLRFEQIPLFQQASDSGREQGLIGPALFALGADMDGQVTIQAQHLRTRHHEIGEPRIQLSFGKDQFSVESLAGRVFGGAVNLSAYLTQSRTGPQLALKGQIERGRLEAAATDIWGVGYANGFFDANWVVAGGADTFQGFASSMKGEAFIRGDNIVVEGLDIRGFAYELDQLARVEDLRPLADLVLTAGATNLDHFSGSFAIDDGVARVGGMEFDGESVQGASRLVVDLVRGTLDTRTRVLLPDTETPWPALVIDYKGDIRRPRRGVELAALEAELAQRVLAANIDNVRADVSSDLRGPARDEKLVPPVTGAERAVRNVPVGVVDTPVHEANQRDGEPLALP